MVGLSVVLLLAGPALAARAPTRSERRALIHAAVCHTPAYCRGAVVERVRVSTKGPYAIVVIGARRRSGYQPNTVLLRHRRRWRDVAVISGQGVPCSVPRSVFVDLQLARYSANGSRCD